MNALRPLVRILGVSALLMLAGCVGAATEGANMAKDKVVAKSNMDAAKAGDAEAQYKVGKALCCSLNEGEGFYNTPESVSWLCKAAAQKHGPAAQKLGEIYAGDVITGVRLMRRVAQTVAGTTTRPAIAYAWLRRAETLGVADARKSATDLWSNLTDPERAEATALVSGKKPLLCEWAAVTRG
jgi:TPR repeat protein